MARILSFEVNDDLCARIIAQQVKEGFDYLSQFLRLLVEESVKRHEENEQ